LKTRGYLRHFLAAACAACLIPATGHADDAAVAAQPPTALTQAQSSDEAQDGASGTPGASSDGDEGGSCVFNPIPDSQMRSFDTDRPTKSNIPYTVDCGHFQYETDVFNYSYQVEGTTRTDVLLVPNPTLKWGLTRNADLELNIAPYEIVTTKDLRTGRSTSVSGPGDLYARVKVNLWGDNGGSTAMALIPYIKAPTAPVGVGNGEVEGGLIAPISIGLPGSYTLLFDPELDILKDNVGSGHHANVANLINLSRGVTASVTAYLEYWYDVNADPQGTVHQSSVDWAVAWLARQNLQFDVGLNTGLNHATPSYQVYVGVSQRF